MLKELTRRDITQFENSVPKIIFDLLCTYGFMLGGAFAATIFRLDLTEPVILFFHLVAVALPTSQLIYLRARTCNRQTSARCRRASPH